MAASEKEEQVQTVYVWSPDHYPRHWCPQVVWPAELERIVSLLRSEVKQAREEISRYNNGLEEESDLQLYLEGYRRGIERVVSTLGDLSRQETSHKSLEKEE
ncbi:MAG: hypothetical protein LUO93_10940 [Methanomicrobiales archaeon]|nr:hypothetical protein [Methanomicrobiales archaeon]